MSSAAPLAVLEYSKAYHKLECIQKFTHINLMNKDPKLDTHQGAIMTSVSMSPASVWAKSCMVVPLGGIGIFTLTGRIQSRLWQTAHTQQTVGLPKVAHFQAAITESL